MASKRPASLIVFGVLHLLLGLMGLLGGITALIFLLSDFKLPEGSFDLQAILCEELPWYQTYATTSVVLGLLVSIVLIVAGIGLFRARECARKATIYYGYYGVAAGLIGAFIVVTQTAPVMNGLLDGANDMDRIAIIAGIGGAYIGVAMGLCYPVLVLIFMNRSALKTAIAESEAERSSAE